MTSAGGSPDQPAAAVRILRLRALSRLAGSAVALLGAMVLASWALDAFRLTSLLPGLVPMKVNTALALILAGGALRAAAARSPPARARGVALAASLLVALLGAVTLAQDAVQLDLGIDNFLIVEPPGVPRTSSPGRMAPITAVCLLLLGAALALLLRERTRAAQLVALPAGFFALFALLGYLYDVEALYGSATTSAMALHTAVALALLAAGVLQARADSGLVAAIVGEGPGAVMARRLLPFALVVPVALGSLRLLGQRAGLYRTATGVSLFVGAIAIVFAGLLWWQARSLDGLEEERRRIAQALARSEARFARLADAGIIGVLEADLQGGILDANDALLGMVGYSREELRDGRLRRDALTPPEWREADAAALAQMDATGVAQPYEKEYLCRDGTRLPVLVGGAMLDGTRSVAFVLDLCSQKRLQAEIGALNSSLEQRVRERTAELGEATGSLRRERALIEAIRDAQARFITSEDPNQVFDRLLDGLLRLTGSAYGFIDELHHTPEGAPYLTARAITNIAWNEETQALYPRFLTGELRFSNLESLFGAVMTSAKPVIANDAPHDPRRAGVPPGHPPLDAFLGLPLISGSEFVGVIGLANAPGGYSEATVAYLEPMVKACANVIAALRNDQLRRRFEEDLRTRNVDLARRSAELEGANREMEAFAYSISHDLRAPLRAIDGFAEVLEEDQRERLDEPGKLALARIRAAATRMGSLIDATLQLSRITRTPLRHEPVDLAVLAREIAEELRRETPEREVGFRCAGAAPVQGDPGLLRMLLDNLLRNAWKFTSKRASACIEFGVLEREQGPAYLVRDDGAGFDMAFAGRLFAPFQRLHSTAEFPGTGIGLATVQRIVRRHGGQVWAESEAGHGATFFFTVPAFQD